MENITLVVKIPQPPKTKSKPPTPRKTGEPIISEHMLLKSDQMLESKKTEFCARSAGNVQPNLGVKLLSAGTAACIADMITFPLDTAKVRLQIQGEAAIGSSGPLYRGITGTLSTIAKTEGPKAWYSGLSAGLQRQMCFASIRIGLYDSMKQFYSNALGVSDNGGGMFGVRILAGLTTGGMAVVAAQPTDVVKVRMQAQGARQGAGARYRGLWHAYSSIAATEGVRGLWKGAFPNIARNSIVNVTELVSYDLIKETILARRLLDDAMPCHVTSAFGAGLTTTLLASPVDVVKTRFMNSSPGAYNGAIDCAAKMFRSEGPKAFYKGFMPSFVRLGSWNVVMFVTYEQIKRLTQTRDTDVVYVTHCVNCDDNKNNNNSTIDFNTLANAHFYTQFCYNIVSN